MAQIVVGRRERAGGITLPAEAICGMIGLERSCKAGSGLPILIQHLKIGSPTRFGAGVQAPGGLAAGEKPEGARGTPTPFYKRGSITGAGTAKWCAPSLNNSLHY